MLVEILGGIRTMERDVSSLLEMQRIPGMTLITVLILMCCAGMAVGIFLIASDIRAIRNEVLPGLITAVRTPSVSRGYGTITADAKGHGTGHKSQHKVSSMSVVWEWRGGEWKVCDDGKAEMCMVGPPPMSPGSYEGDLVRRWVSGIGR